MVALLERDRRAACSAGERRNIADDDVAAIRDRRRRIADPLSDLGERGLAQRCRDRRTRYANAIASETKSKSKTRQR